MTQNANGQIPPKKTPPPLPRLCLRSQRPLQIRYHPFCTASTQSRRAGLLLTTRWSRVPSPRHLPGVETAGGIGEGLPAPTPAPAPTPHPPPLRPPALHHPKGGGTNIQRAVPVRLPLLAPCLSPRRRATGGPAPEGDAAGPGPAPSPGPPPDLDRRLPTITSTSGETFTTAESRGG